MARAKSTARAEARRRYRAEQGLPPEVSPDDASETAAQGSGGGSRPAAGQPARMGLTQAFKSSFHPAHVREDLRALPAIATRSNALWIPIALTIGSMIVVLVVPPNIVSQFAYAYFVQTPAIGGVFIAGFLAPRASWLLGLIVGLVSAICYSILILVVPPAAGAPAATGSQSDIILAALVLSPGLGILFASAAAWYRRFLQLSNPNRGRRQAPPAKRGPDGRSRGGSQKAGARR